MSKKFLIDTQYYPRPGFSGIEWYWEATAEIVDGVVYPKIESPFSFDTIEEAKQNFNDAIGPYLEALTREKLHEVKIITT